MKWYLAANLRRTIEAGVKPPAYIIERISDLKYASNLFPRSPSEARDVVSTVVDQLTAHYDSEYVPLLKEALKISLDSPSRAVAVINSVIENMNLDKIEFEEEKLNPWIR